MRLANFHTSLLGDSSGLAYRVTRILKSISMFPAWKAILGRSIKQAEEIYERAFARYEKALCPAAGV